MSQQRREERKKLIAFTPVYDSHQNILLGYLGDLTIQGAMMVGEKPMEIDKQIRLAIDFPETPELPAIRMTIPARVAWCRQEKNPRYFNTGFEFQEIDQQNKKFIEAILERYQFRREMPA
jgi:Tfp pilus assembly protein PilZ